MPPRRGPTVLLLLLLLLLAASAAAAQREMRQAGVSRRHRHVRGAGQGGIAAVAARRLRLRRRGCCLPVQHLLHAAGQRVARRQRQALPLCLLQPHVVVQQVVQVAHAWRQRRAARRLEVLLGLAAAQVCRQGRAADGAAGVGGRDARRLPGRAARAPQHHPAATRRQARHAGAAAPHHTRRRAHRLKLAAVLAYWCWSR